MRSLQILIMSLLIAACASETKETLIDDSLDIVYINNGSIQCESEGIPARETAQQLINRGIDVISSKCAFLTGIGAPAQCGLPGTMINIHVINAQNVPDAKELGFERVTTLRLDNTKGYEVIDCPQ